MVTPLGCDVAATWKRLVSGGTAGRDLSPVEIDHHDALLAVLGRIPSGAPAACQPSLEQMQRLLPGRQQVAGVAEVWLKEPFVAYLLAALHEAAMHAQLTLPVDSPDRTGCIIGASKGGLRTLEQLTQRQSAFSIDNSAATDTDTALLWRFAAHPDATVRAAAIVTGARARQSCPVAACATGLISVIQAAAAIQSGDCDICFAGSSDAALRASVMSAYHRLRVISRRTDPAAACRPFDKSRDGFMIGEGAAVLVLESRSHAMARRVTPIARLSAGGWLTDPSGMTQISTDGSCVAELIGRVTSTLPDSHSVDWIGLHGTGTESNDLAESAAISTAFGANEPICTGWKGSLGHLLGAAGSVETALAVKALHERLVPHTANLSEPDPRCHIDPLTQNRVLPNMYRSMKLSLGFGGHAACAVFDRE
jgi:3-oxoacyl-[acyl-carrier-protein] synthase II